MTTPSNLDKLVRMREEFEALDRSSIRETGGRDRDALMRLSEVAGQMAEIHEDEAAEMRRVAASAYDLATTK